jgi:hypothetical protein
MNLDLRIEELILHGVPSADREQVAGAIGRALTRLFEQHGVPPGLARLGEIDRLGAPALSLRPGDDAEALGARIARAIYDGLATEGHHRQGISPGGWHTQTSPTEAIP